MEDGLPWVSRSLGWRCSASDSADLLVTSSSGRDVRRAGRRLLTKTRLRDSNEVTRTLPDSEAQLDMVP